MKLSEEFRKTIDRINNNRGLNALDIIIALTEAYNKYIPKVEALEKQNEQLQQEKKELSEFLKSYIIEKRGRWGTYHFEFSFQKGDYQNIHKITGDTKEQVMEQLLSKIKE